MEYSRLMRDSVRHGISCSFILSSTIFVTSARKRFVLSALPFDDVLQFLIGLRIEIAERKIFEFAADFAHAEPVGQRRIDLHRFARDGFTPVGREIFQRSHVVQAIGKFHHDDANIVGHGEQHFAEVLGLLLFLRCELDLADLGDAVDDVGDFGPEEFFDLFERCQRVFDDVVEQADADGDGIHLHFGQDVGDFERMSQIGFTGGAHLSLVFFGGEDVGAANQVEVVAGMVLLDLFENLLEANHVS